MRNLALELSTLEMNTFIRSVNKEMIGSQKDVQIEKSSPRATKAGNEQYQKER